MEKSPDESKEKNTLRLNKNRIEAWSGNEWVPVMQVDATEKPNKSFLGPIITFYSPPLILTAPTGEDAANELP